MEIVYALSPKGRHERTAGRPSLPAQLHQLLCMVDGRRTRSDLLQTVGKSALTVGGLRWLAQSGYIQSTAPASLEQAVHSRPAAVRPAGQPESMPQSVAPAGSRSDAEVCSVLSEFMVRAITRHLGEGGYPHQRQIARAVAVHELLPHLHPLIEIILARAGSEAAAEFADTAAFILHPLGDDIALA